MATATRIPLEAYLITSYEPDKDYVDGVLEERNVGEYDHNVVQRAILFWFYLREKEWNIRALQEQRTRVAAGRVRIPDVSIFSRALPVEQVFTRPPAIAIEVLSPEDRHSRMDEKIGDYITFGVPNIWIVDPALRTGWDCSAGDWVRKDRFSTAASQMYLSLPELFARIDEENV